MNGYQISKEEQRELFGDAFDDGYAQEAEERWGETDAWAQSRRRTKNYTKAQWQQIKYEGRALNDAFAALMASDEPAAGFAAMDCAEQARDQINAWFYDCPPQMHVQIAGLYVSDPRFTATYEDHTVGLAQFVHDAIEANAERHAR